ncbi:MAG: GNAT family N-acetyltransferase [Chitinophagaceae bacterium]
MELRVATAEDIPQIQVVRNAVKENVLSNPALVPDEDVLDYISCRGKGWVAIVGEIIVGFAIADLADHSIWALFLLPEYEGRGIGRQLHDTMVDWYFTQTKGTIWLSTAENTRAELFYSTAGWTPVGRKGKMEIKFEMSYKGWQKKRMSL